jgi:glycosyltransferase involved in cell wall biosynthesis
LTAEERARIVRITEFPDHEKASIYDAFDVFALPSASESFGIVYLEAWLCGKPVIGARIGSTQSVICEGTDGLLVEPENALDIARAIIDLLSNPDKRERLGKNGQAKILAQFTWDKVTDKVEEIYRDLYRTKASRCLSSLRIEERPS